MKKILLVISAVLLLGVAALLVAPSFIDWNEQKARIAEEVAAATGERIAIEGDVSLALLPSPRLSAGGVRLAGDDGQPDRVVLKSLDLRIALAPLLGGEIEVVSLVMVEPEVRFAIDAAGVSNWTRSRVEDSGAAASGAQGSAGGEEDIALSVRSLTVQGGTVIYSDARSGQELRIEEIQADISADSLAGPFRLEGGLLFAGEAMELSASLGRLDRATGASSTLSVKAPELDNTALVWDGILAPDGPALRGKLTLSGDSIERLSRFAPLREFGLPSLASDFEVTADLRYEAERATLEDAALRLGSSSLRASGALSLAPETDVRLELTASRIDADELMAALAAPAVGDEGTAEDAGEPATAAPLALPSDMSGRVDMTAETLIYRGGTVRQAELRASLQGGESLIEILGATLPGGTEVFVSGRLATPPEGPAFDGGLELRANDLRQTLSWLGQDVTGIADDRLRRLILVSDVSAQAMAAGNRLDLNNLTADLDASRLRGGIALRLGDRPGLGVGISVDRLNLDAYMPASGEEAAREEQAPGDQGPADNAQDASPLAVLDSFDANFDLQAEELVLRGGALQGVRAQGSLVGGTLTLSDLTVGGFPGGQGRLSGRLVGLADSPRLEDGRFDVSLEEPASLLRYLGRPDDQVIARLGPVAAQGSLDGDQEAASLSIGFSGLGGSGQLAAILRGLQESPSVETGSLSLSRMEGASLAAVLGLPATHPLARLGVFDLAVQASGTEAAVDYDATLSALGGRLLSQGQLADYLGDLPKLNDVSVTLEGIEAARLAQLAGLPAGETLQRLGAVSLTSRMNGTPESLSYGTRLAVLGTDVRAQGTAQGLPSGLPDFAFDLDVRSEDMRRLLGALFPGEAVGQPGALSLAAKVSGSPLRLSVAELAAEAGRTRLDGNVNLDLTAARPRLDTTLAFGELVLADFLPGQAASDGGGGGGSGAASDSDSGWSREPLPLDGLRALDGTMAATFVTLDTGDLRLDNAALDARLDGGVLTLERLDGQLGGGNLAVSGTVDASNSAAGADSDVSLRLDGVSVGPLLRAAGVEHKIEGLLNLDGRFAARGASELELVSTLNGAGSASGNLSFQPGGLEQGANLVAGLLGAAVQQVQGFTDPVNALFGAFGQAPVALSLTYQAERGVLRSNDILVQGQGAQLTGQGVLVDLPRGTTALDLAVVLEGDTEPYITVALGGPLDSPNASFGGNILRRGLNLDTSQGAPSSPQDLIEGIVGGVLGAPGQSQSGPQSEPQSEDPAQPPSEENVETQQQEPDPGEQLLRGIFRGILTPQ